MIELEMVFYELIDNMEFVECFFKCLFKDVFVNCEEDMMFFNEWIDNMIFDMFKGIVDFEFFCVLYMEVV